MDSTPSLEPSWLFTWDVYLSAIAELENPAGRNASCLAYLEQVRWGGGFTCLDCSQQEYWQCSPGVRKCQSCRAENVVTAGSVFFGTRVPLVRWFRAAWELSDLKSSISIHEFEEIARVGDQAAKRILRELRRAMGNADQKLSGEIKMCGFPFPCRGNRRTSQESGAEGLVLVAAEAGQARRLRKLRMQLVSDFLPETQHFFKGEWVLPPCDVRVPLGWGTSAAPMLKSPGKGETRLPADVLAMYVPSPPVNAARSRFLERFQKVQHSEFSTKHLQEYLNEFVFLQNMRGTSQGHRFYRLIQLALKTPRIEQRSKSR